MAGSSRSLTIEELIGEHHALLSRYAYRLCGSAADADDLTQQTYLLAHENLHQLRDRSSAKSWLCTIMRHAYLRQRRGQPGLAPLECAAEYPDSESNTAVDEEALQQALNELPEEYRSAVILYYFQELSYQEIAAVLEVPLGTVMSRLSRGKGQLKSLLEQRERRQSVARWPASVPTSRETAPSRLVPAYPN